MSTTLIAAGVETDSLFLRTTYFLQDPHDRNVAEQPLFLRDAPSLSDVAQAITHTDDYVRAAQILGEPDWPPAHLLARTYRLGKFATPYATRVVSIEMRSPLTILVDLPPVGIIGMGLGLVMLAERICTFGPRVSRKRKEDLLRAARLDSEQAQLLRSRADALAIHLLDSGGEPLDQIDLIDPEAPDDDLERIFPHEIHGD